MADNLIDRAQYYLLSSDSPRCLLHSENNCTKCLGCVCLHLCTMKRDSDSVDLQRSSVLLKKAVISRRRYCSHCQMQGVHSIEAWTQPAPGKKEGSKIMHIAVKIRGKKD